MAEAQVTEAETDADHAAVRDLCRDFRAWLYERYADMREGIDAYYAPDRFESLLARLPELHRPPAGAILLARLDERPAGCAMLARLDDDVVEMKRLFVRREARGAGVARRLCEAAIDRARAAGYRTMRLDTGPRHDEALALYERLGFRRRSAYYDAGDFWRDKLVFMERPLDPASG